MFKRKLSLLTSAAAILTLVACGNNAANDQANSSATGNASESTSAMTEGTSFEKTVTNEGTPISGGTLRYALVSDSPIPGVFSTLHYDKAPDGEVMNFLDTSIIGYDETLQYDQSGMVEWTFNDETKVLTLKLKSADFKWSDGQPFTIDDYIYALEVVAHPDYKGIRYDDQLEAIEGMTAYHNGEATSISGIKKVDDQTVELQFLSVSPSLFRPGGLWSYAAPKHLLSSIPIPEQAASDVVRKNPVGLGPFVATSIVEGESVTAKANPHYWKGQPKLDGVVIEVVSSATIADEMAKGNYDLTSMPNSAYEQFKELTNVKLLGQWSNAYNYIGFKLGHRDRETNKNVVDPTLKMADISLRQAMGYAIDNELVAEQFYKGMRRRANSFIPPFFPTLNDGSLEGYTYNEEKAKKLLDDAGYKDVDGDGLRENKNGEKLTINFGMAGGDAVSEPIAQYYLQSWKKVGLDVQLLDGRLLEFKAFYDRIEADDPSIDVYVGGWQTGYDPLPTMWSANGAPNYSRYSTEKLSELYDKLNSVEALDEAKSVALYKEWQEEALKEAFAIPTLYRMSVTAVNNRVKYYDATPGSDFGYEQVELLAEKGAAQ